MVRSYISSNTYFGIIAENDFNEILTISVFGISIQNERNNSKQKMRNENSFLIRYNKIIKGNFVKCV